MLTTAIGKPHSEREFNKWFRRQVIAAGLPEHCTPHGLRKAFARRCFEAGCTVPETAGGTGHAWTSEETIVQVHGQGPFALTYVNPADDPTK